MKKSILGILAIVLVSLFTFCSGDKKLAASQVPAAVVQAFSAKYPGAADVEWKTEKSDGKMVYEAEFKMNDKKLEAEFDEAGVFIQEED